MLKMMRTLLLASMLFFYSVVNSNASSDADLMPAGTVSIFKSRNATLHSFMAPPSSGLVTTQIIELKNKLIVIDAQFLRSDAKHARAYIDGLKKPIDRVIVSHAHPDHWFGLEFYTDVPIYALKQVRDTIDQFGEQMIQSKRAKLGDLVIDKKVKVTHLLTEESEKIDGLTFEFIAVKDAEADVQLLIRLPEIKTLVVQDLVYEGVHMFVGNNQLANWQVELKKILSENKYQTLLVGHGRPAPIKAIDNALNYLLHADTAIKSSKNSQELKNKLVADFPGYDAAFLIDISGKYLYPEKK